MFFAIALLIAFLVAAVLWAVADVVYAGAGKSLEETNKFAAKGRVAAALVWLLFGALAMVLPILFWGRIGVLAGGAMTAWIVGQVARGKALMAANKAFKTTNIALRFWLLLMVPLTAVVGGLANFLLRKWGVDPAALNAGVSEDEIRQMVKEGGEKGSIDMLEQEMIDNIFEFDDKSAQDICTHRTDIEAIDAAAGRDEIIQIIVEAEFSRYPVYEESIDNIIGVVHIKDILKHIFTEKDLLENFDLRDHMKEPYFVPVSKKIDDLFEELNKASKVHMAIVVDEYGGCYGLLTVEDLLEEIVGKIYDESDVEESPDFEEDGEGRYKIMGGASLVEAAETLGIELPVEDYETIGGFLVHLLERIPTDGEQPSVAYEGYNFHVQDVRERRIYSVLAERTPDEEELKIES